jgi:predicted dienelactone hydrolase
MNKRILALIVASLSLMAPARAATVAVFDGVWTNAQRHREVPYRIRYPADATNRCAVIVLSHGLGGSREGYVFLGEDWASNGYIVVHLQHPGSDDSVWKGAADAMQEMRAAAANPKLAVDRARDFSFAIDELAALDTAGPLKGRIDTNRIGAAGHSFGAHTVLCVSGLRMARLGPVFRDARVKSALAMSSPVPRSSAEDAWNAIRIPVLHMTGTRDDSRVGDTQADQRRIPFDRSPNSERYLVTFNGGDHMIFSGRPRALAVPTDAKFQELIKLGSLAFWHATLDGDAKAREWLRDGGYEKALGEDATFERKDAISAPQA